MGLRDDLLGMNRTLDTPRDRPLKRIRSTSSWREGGRWYYYYNWRQLCFVSKEIIKAKGAAVFCWWGRDYHRPKAAGEGEIIKAKAAGKGESIKAKVAGEGESIKAKAAGEGEIGQR